MLNGIHLITIYFSSDHLWLSIYSNNDGYDFYLIIKLNKRSPFYSITYSVLLKISNVVDQNSNVF